MGMQFQHSDTHEQHYLMGELESLGLSTIRLNEFNDNEELRGLVKRIKEVLLKQYSKATEGHFGYEPIVGVAVSDGSASLGE
ncbi:MAG: hypothetical protein ACREBU_09225 [Nitrososphaera sp.]